MEEHYTQRGFNVFRIGRQSSDARWGDQKSINKAVDGADLLINLAGKSVNCRYTRRNREEILFSRISTTASLRTAVQNATKPPNAWLNASTSTIYRYSMDRPMNEHDGELGTGFSVDVARNWEREFFEGTLPCTRRLALRMSIVLGDGPATRMLLTLGRFGLGGPQYDGWWFRHKRYRGIGPDPTDEAVQGRRSQGKQKFSWIHVDDVLGAIDHLESNTAVSGPVNLVSPQVTTNDNLMRSIRKVVKRKFGFPAYRWMLEPAMWLLRTEPELVLKSRWVEPAVLTETGYEFIWSQLEPALRSVAGGHPRNVGSLRESSKYS